MESVQRVESATEARSGGTVEPYYVSSPGELSAALESILDRLRAEVIP
ncbi:MAG TPA: hypothetical protein VEL74_12020 [Thermoanaerobaculia bacterium]|nr:hypothetical protein [Thermoanaerobaculia bacterium]